MKSISLAAKCIVVTGGTRGIGAAIALDVARSSAIGICISGRNVANGKEMAAVLDTLGSKLETVMGDKEDGHGAEGKLSRDQLLTSPDEGGKFVRETKVDALVIARGTSHGAYKFSRKPDGKVLAMHVIEEVHKKLPSTHLVMHGSSSVPQQSQDIINKYGGKMRPTWGVLSKKFSAESGTVSAKSISTRNNRMAMTGQIRRVLAEDPSEFDPRKYLMPAQAAASGIQHRRTGVEIQTCRNAR